MVHSEPTLNQFASIWYLLDSKMPPVCSSVEDIACRDSKATPEDSVGIIFLPFSPGCVVFMIGWAN